MAYTNLEDLQDMLSKLHVENKRLVKLVFCNITCLTTIAPELRGGEVSRRKHLEHHQHLPYIA